MSDFETQHIFIIKKEEKGVLFAECIRHAIPEFGVGIQKGEHFEMVYIGTDKKHADELYSSLVSERKKNS